MTLDQPNRDTRAYQAQQKRPYFDADWIVPGMSPELLRRACGVVLYFLREQQGTLPQPEPTASPGPRVNVDEIRPGASPELLKQATRELLHVLREQQAGG